MINKPERFWREIYVVCPVLEAREWHIYFNGNHLIIYNFAMLIDPDRD